MGFIVDRYPLNKLGELFLQLLGFNGRLRTAQAVVALRAVVVDVARAEAIDLVFRRHHEAADTAPDETSKGKCVALRLLGPWLTQPPPKPVEMPHGDQRLVLSWVESAVPIEVTSVEGIRKNLVERGAREALCFIAAALWCPIPPFLCCD